MTLAKPWMRFAAVGGATVLVVAVALFIVLRPHPAAGIEASGIIEATESDVAPKVEGRLERLLVRDGDAVRKGEPVAVLESVRPTLSLRQMQANAAAAAAQAQAAQAAYDLQRTTYVTTLSQAGSAVGIAASRLNQAGENLGVERQAATLGVDQARAQILLSQAAYDRAEIDLRRTRNLVASGDEARQMLDDANNAYAASAAQLRAARDAVGVAQANLRNVAVRQLDVRTSALQHVQSLASLRSAQAKRELVTQRHDQLVAAQAAAAQAQAALALERNDVEETTLLAPFDGYVVSHNFEVGDLILPGSAVMTIGDLNHPYLYVYVSETDLPHIKEGMRADASIDGFPGRSFAGRVTEIAGTAEFTPENVQTKEERIEYLVFRVKIQFTDTTGELKPGLPADAIIHD